MIRRGSDTASELANAQRLLDAGAGETWGWGTPAGRRRVERRVRFMANALGLAPGVRALELGCGTGIFTAPMTRHGADITGVDIADVLLERARQACSATLVCADLMSPGLDLPGPFDAVYGVSVLHHLDLDTALPNVARFLRPGARFAFSEPNLRNPLNRHWYFKDNAERRARLGMSATEMAFFPAELRGALELHGFAVRWLRERDFLHPAVPGPLSPLVDVAGRVVERIPLVHAWAGSLWCTGTYRGAP